jgi:hypothetical protein
MQKQSCAGNLGPKQKRRRLFFGVLMFSLASIAALGMMGLEVPPFFRGIVFVPFFAAMLGFFQAKERTCVLYAAQGIQNLDRGPEKVENPELSNRLRRQAQKILLQAALAAFGLTLLCVYIY